MSKIGRVTTGSSVLPPQKSTTPKKPSPDRHVLCWRSFALDSAQSSKTFSCASGRLLTISAQFAVLPLTQSPTSSTVPPVQPTSLQTTCGANLEKSRPFSLLTRPSTNFRLSRRFLLGKGDEVGLLQSRLLLPESAVMVASGAHQFGQPAVDSLYV